MDDKNGMEFFWIFALLLLAGGGSMGGNNATTQEVLFGQKFQGLDNKIDRLANGLADSTYALNNAISGVQSNLGGAIISEGRGLADKLYALGDKVHAEGEATRSMLQQNKIESLQAQVNELKTQNMFCGVPKISPYMYNVQPNCGCNCGNF